MAKVIPFFAILSVGLGLFVWKAPHMRLAAQLASGQLDGHRIPVSDFVPARFEEARVPVRVGGLVFDVPDRAVMERGPSGTMLGLWVKLDGVRCRVLPPRYEAPEDSPASWDASDTFGRDELSRRIAICAASGQDLSVWMSASEVELLQERLESRPAFCLRAERVEAVRGPTLSGLLLTWKVEGVPRMVFTYFSPDNRIAGSAFLYLDSDSTEAVRAARALITSFSLEPGSIARPGGEPD